MEGSRHEKAALISVAYLIGAVTVFIGLYSTTSLGTESRINLVATMPAAVISATDLDKREPSLSAEAAADVVIGNVSYLDGVLAIQTALGRKILSFNPTTSGLEVSADFVRQGAHLGSLPFVSAPGERFVFFCEQKDVPGDCSPFIYDALVEKVYGVKADSNNLALSLEEAEQTTWDAHGLSVPRFIVVNPEKPWLLMTKSNE
jgi:hypothetical protein